MDTKAFVTSGLFEVVNTEGRSTLILRKPVRIVVPTGILSRLAKSYPKSRETGGFLYAEANTQTGTLTIIDVVELKNQATADTAFQPLTSDYQAAIARAVNNGLLPLRFHTHPVNTVNDLYNIQSLNFFNKTSQADRHNSYLPIYIGGQAMVLPDCLVSPNDRAGETIRFSIYNGFIAPTSFAALLPNEQAFIGVVGVVLLIAVALVGWQSAKSAIVVSGLIALFVFVKEKRPDYTYSGKGLEITS